MQDGAESPLPTGNGCVHAQESNNRLWEVLKDVIQYALLPILYLGYTQIDTTIKSNADVLRDVQVTQIRVVETIRTIQSDLAAHEAKNIQTAFDVGRVHHTSAKSCIECKTRDNYTGIPVHSKPMFNRENPPIGIVK